MMYFENFAPGTSFEAGRTPRARGPGRRRVLQKAFGRLQEALWRIQGALGRLHKVLEGFWAKNIDFSLIFNPRPASPNTASPQPCMEPPAKVAPCVSLSVLS